MARVSAFADQGKRASVAQSATAATIMANQPPNED